MNHRVGARHHTFTVTMTPMQRREQYRMSVVTMVLAETALVGLVAGAAMAGGGGMAAHQRPISIVSLSHKDEIISSMSMFDPHGVICPRA